MVPKVVMHFVVNGFKEKLQTELVAQLYRWLLTFILLWYAHLCDLFTFVTCSPYHSRMSSSCVNGRESILTELMRETDDVATRRKSCLEMRDLLARALDIVNEVRDFKPAR